MWWRMWWRAYSRPTVRRFCWVGFVRTHASTLRSVPFTSFFYKELFSQVVSSVFSGNSIPCDTIDNRCLMSVNVASFQFKAEGSNLVSTREKWRLSFIFSGRKCFSLCQKPSVFYVVWLSVWLDISKPLMNRFSWNWWTDRQWAKE